jgi:hypothetical protein
MVEIEEAMLICQRKNFELPLEIQGKRGGVVFTILLREDQKKYAEKICKNCLSGTCSHLRIEGKGWVGYVRKDGNTEIFQKEDTKGFIIEREKVLGKKIRNL